MLRYLLTSVLLVSALAGGLASGGAAAQDAAPAPAAPKTQPGLLPMPPWAEVEIVNAVDHAGTVKGSDRDFEAALGGLPRLIQPNFGPSSGLQVNLATGIESYLPMADLVVHNPTGSDLVFQRSYRSDRALKGYGSPGLSPGWVHNCDVVLKPMKAAGTWSELALVYPSGERDHIKPVLDAQGQPTGDFLRANSAPFTARGLPSASPNVWQAVTIVWKDGTQWQFVPFDNEVYALAQSEDLRFNWDKRRALTSVVDTRSGKALLTLSYDARGYLAAIADNTDRNVTYAFGPPPNLKTQTPHLLFVSTIFSDRKDQPIRWSYGYAGESAQPLLSQISVPSPTGAGVSTCTILYAEGKVVAHVDGNGNQRCYTYTRGHTRVEVKGPDGQVVLFWTQNYDALGRNTGTTDALGQSDSLGYGEAAGPPKPGP